MRTNPILLIVAATIAVTTAACAATTGGASTAPVISAAPSTSPDTSFVADVDIDGGRTLHVVCLGPIDTGRPTVIFEAGLEGRLGQWADVLGPLQGTDRGCSYDRAGVGQSAAAPGPRTTADQVDDLRALLAAGAIKGPYVLVGFSSGAWNSLLHAATHPDDVAGVVLVDPRPALASERFLAELPAETAGESGALTQYRADYTEWERDPTGNLESLHLADSAAEVAAVTDLGDLPLIVLAADGSAGLEGSELGGTLGAAFEDIHWELQDGLAALSSTGRLEKVTGTGHDMPSERPGAILDAIRELLAG
ncbi:alpha/beta hydrolase [soil metagenome]